MLRVFLVVSWKASGRKRTESIFLFLRKSNISRDLSTRLLDAFAVVIDFMHFYQVSSSNVSMSQARHLLRLNTGMDLELCIASRMLELDDLLERLETSLCLTIALKSFISICNYASVYNRPKVLRKCYTWLKRYTRIVHCHSEMVAR